MTKGEDKPERFILHLKPLQGALEAFCRRSLYDVSLVEDVLQEAVPRAFRDFGLFSEGTNFRAWIFRYLKSVIEYNEAQFRLQWALGWTIVAPSEENEN